MHPLQFHSGMCDQNIKLFICNGSDCDHNNELLCRCTTSASARGVVILRHTQWSQCFWTNKYVVQSCQFKSNEYGVPAVFSY